MEMSYNSFVKQIDNNANPDPRKNSKSRANTDVGIQNLDDWTVNHHQRSPCHA